MNQDKLKKDFEATLRAMNKQTLDVLQGGTEAMPYSGAEMMVAAARYIDHPELRFSCLSLLLAKALNCLAGRCGVADLDQSLKALGITPLINHHTPLPSLPAQYDPSIACYTVGGVTFSKEQLLKNYERLKHHLLREELPEMRLDWMVKKWSDTLPGLDPAKTLIAVDDYCIPVVTTADETHRPAEANPQVTVMEEIP
jgi:hypothetical protein